MNDAHIPKWMGQLAVACYIAHAIELLLRFPASNLLWSCNVASLCVCVGLLTRRPTWNAMGVCMLTVGNAVWFIELGTGGELLPTAPLTHLGIYALSLVAAYRMGLPRYTWFYTCLAIGAALILARLAGPASENINFAFGIPEGWSAYAIPLSRVPDALTPWQSSHALYLVINGCICAVQALAIQWVLPRLGFGRHAGSGAPATAA